MIFVQKIYVSFFAATLFCVVASAQHSWSEDLQLLRSGEKREWDTFPEGSQPAIFKHTFNWKEASKPGTLRLSQHNVKQRWQVEVNGEKVAVLHRDENPLTAYWEVDSKFLRDGENTLTVQNTERKPRGSDDILVGRVELIDRPLDKVLNEATLSVNVTETKQHNPIPSRITIINEHGELQMVGAESNDHLAVRTGTVYTSTGQATFGLPAGKYTIFAGRGFEYSLTKRELTVKAGNKVTLNLEIERQVDTTGFIACDTHVHTLTNSGHGDSSVQERMITLAAEGIELPIATDHNVQIDHRSFAKEMNVSQYFTPVVGNEYTTSVGHFNIFPLSATEPPPNHKLDNWPDIFEELNRTAKPPVIILNHARDVHGGTTPFGPKNHLAIVGENLHGWPIGFNAMEVINSGATQTDPRQLFLDWMNMLNAGHRVTPVGSSDSHDVTRYTVGQGRTYIRSTDTNAGKISVDGAVKNFLDGDVNISYGLFTTLDLHEAAANDDHVILNIETQSPYWIHPTEVSVFANGREIFLVPNDKTGSISWKKSVRLPKPKHDVFYVAIATGPGIEQPYWRTALPYQPDSISTKTYVIGCSGAKWFDADGDGKITSAREYAEQLFSAAGKDLPKALRLFEEGMFDSAVGAHLAHTFRKNGGSLASKEFQSGIRSTVPGIRDGFNDYLREWRDSQIARSTR